MSTIGIMANGLGSYFRIIGAFHSDPARGITIRQAALKTQTSYGFAHFTCSKMLQEGLLKGQRIGNSVVCSLNFENDLTILLLALVSAERTHKTFQADPTLAGRVRQTLTVLGNPKACVLLTPDGLAVAGTDHEIVTMANGERVFTIKPDQLATVLQKATVVQNFELAWRLAMLGVQRKPPHALP